MGLRGVCPLRCRGEVCLVLLERVESTPGLSLDCLPGMKVSTLFAGDLLWKQARKEEAPPQLCQASLLTTPPATPTSPGHHVRNRGPLFPLKFPVSLYGTQGYNKFSSKWLESCFEKVEREGFIACPNFHVAFVPLAQLTMPGFAPLHLNEGRWNGLNLGLQCSHCRLWRAFEQNKSASPN